MKLKYIGKIPIRILGIGDIQPGMVVEMDDKKAQEFLRLPTWEAEKKSQRKEVNEEVTKEVTHGRNRNR